MGRPAGEGTPFAVLPPDIAARVRALPSARHHNFGGGASSGEAIRLLLAGEMLHFDDQRRHFNATNLRRAYGVRLRTRVDGDGGSYWWVEPIDAP